MSGLCRQEPLGKGQPNPWAGKFGDGCRVCQVRTEGCWEKSRFALICKICTIVSCPRVETKHQCGAGRRKQGSGVQDKDLGAEGDNRRKHWKWRCVLRNALGDQKSSGQCLSGYMCWEFS